MKEEKNLVRLVCDRCSAERELNKAWPNDRRDISNWLQAIYRDKELVGEIDGIELVGHLCPSCRDQFNDWFYTNPASKVG